MVNIDLLRKIIHLSAMICCCCVAADVGAQQQRYTANLRNTFVFTTIDVSSATGNEPLIGATIKIVCRKETIVGATQQIKLPGIVQALYFYEKIPSDSVDLTVSYVGFKPFHKRYSIEEFCGHKRIQLLDDEKMISQIVVIGEQVAMVLKGDTTYYNAASFKTLAGANFQELLRQLPGVNVQGNKIFASGQQVKRIFVNGRNFFGDNPEYSLSDVKAEDVRSVKVFDQQSSTAKYLNDTIAPKEKVMDIVTHKKSEIMQGGVLSAMIGYSLDESIYGDEDLRYQAMAELFRNREGGNIRARLVFNKNASEMVQQRTSSTGITPVSFQDIIISNSFRKGDSLSWSNTLRLERKLSKSISDQSQEYFPNDAYNLRNQTSSLDAQNLINIVSLTSRLTKRRQGNEMYIAVSGAINWAENKSHNVVQQNIDNQQITLDRRTEESTKGGEAKITLSTIARLSRNTQMSVDAYGQYVHSKVDEWVVDTTASDTKMRIELNNDAGGDKINATADISVSSRLAKRCAISLKYKLNYTNNKSRRLSVDYINDPVGELDAINSYNYTVNSLRNIASPSVNWKTNRDISFLITLRNCLKISFITILASGQ